MKNSKFIKQINFLDKEYIKNKKELYDNIEYVKSNLESLYMNINLAENDLIDYYGSAMSCNPMSVVELSDVQTASNAKLVQIAIQNGFDLNEYEQKTKSY